MTAIYYILTKQTINPNKSWFMWAVSRKQIFTDLSYKFAWGISYDNQWFPWHNTLIGIANNNNIDLYHFDNSKCEVDLLLDVDKGELKICLVGQKSKDKEAIMSGIKYPDNENQGFVPHINFGSSYVPIKVQIAKIPIEWYGEIYDDIFTL